MRICLCDGISNLDGEGSNGVGPSSAPDDVQGKVVAKAEGFFRGGIDTQHEPERGIDIVLGYGRYLKSQDIMSAWPPTTCVDVAVALMALHSAGFLAARKVA